MSKILKFKIIERQDRKGVDIEFYDEAENILYSADSITVSDIDYIDDVIMSFNHPSHDHFDEFYQILPNEQRRVLR